MKTIDYTVLASGLYLTKPLPANWRDLTSTELRDLCTDTCLPDYRGLYLFRCITASANTIESMALFKRLPELESAVKELHGSISSIHAGYSKQLSYKQKLYEATLANYHGVLARDSEKIITELTARVRYLERELSEVGTSLAEIQVITNSALS